MLYSIGFITVAEVEDCEYDVKALRFDDFFASFGWSTCWKKP